MESKSTFKAAMGYGALLGLGLIIISVIFYLIGKSDSGIVQYLNYAAIIAALIYGIKDYRDNYLGGYISYGKSLGTGTLIALFASIITAFYLFIFLSFIDQAFIANIVEKSMQAMREQNKTEEEIEMAMKYSHIWANPTMFAIISIIGTTFIGFIFSLIISIFMKKEDPSFESNFR
jgi:hypothetical protein